MFALIAYLLTISYHQFRFQLNTLIANKIGALCAPPRIQAIIHI